VEFVLAGDSYAASAMIVECGLSKGDSATLHVAAFPGLRVVDFVVRREEDRVTVSGADSSRILLDPAGRPARIEVGGSDVVVHRVSFAQPGFLPSPGPGLLRRHRGWMASLPGDGARPFLPGHGGAPVR